MTRLIPIFHNTFILQFPTYMLVIIRSTVEYKVRISDFGIWKKQTGLHDYRGLFRRIYPGFIVLTLEGSTGHQFYDGYCLRESHITMALDHYFYCIQGNIAVSSNYHAT